MAYCYFSASSALDSLLLRLSIVLWIKRARLARYSVPLFIPWLILLALFSFGALPFLPARRSMQFIEHAVRYVQPALIIWSLACELYNTYELAYELWRFGVALGWFGWFFFFGLVSLKGLDPTPQKVLGPDRHVLPRVHRIYMPTAYETIIYCGVLLLWSPFILRYCVRGLVQCFSSVSLPLRL